jgi:uncharacterized SAM-binding protein YcdF (DUF218 family)
VFFPLSKILWMLTAPATLLVLAVLCGAGLGGLRSPRLARRGRRLATGGALALLACGMLPFGTALLRPLEDRFPVPPATTPAPTGIIVLGGSTDQDIAAARGRVTIANAGDRMTEAVVLARRYPEARLVFTGGSSALTGATLTEAADARKLWTQLGVPTERITTEDRSRNTDENVRFSRALVDPKPGETWMLVTSAYHMPRAVALFRANGWPVIPDPVDYRTLGTAADFRPTADLSDGLARLDMAVHEWIGLIAYRVTGKTRTLLPEP